MAKLAGAGISPVSEPKSNRSGSRKRIRLLLVGVLALVIWAAGTAWTQMKNIHLGSERLGALENKMNQAQDTNAKLKREIERLSDPEYRAERMRKDMHLSKEGETVFEVPRSNP
ncbi:FtsB family cell division protein [Gorillibacterium sp. sgz5001074]|uniref:FtsB family cell division protein n=1 Tax=Gorillibacterium sp. sgz5001074 TaxID=3446695 RepID=UPI003F660E1F